MVVEDLEPAWRWAGHRRPGPPGPHCGGGYLAGAGRGRDPVNGRAALKKETS